MGKVKEIIVEYEICPNCKGKGELTSWSGPDMPCRICKEEGKIIIKSITRYSLTK